MFDFVELMYGVEGVDCGKVFDVDVIGECVGVGEDDFVINVVVVGYV